MCSIIRQAVSLLTQLKCLVMDQAFVQCFLRLEINQYCTIPTTVKFSFAEVFSLMFIRGILGLWRADRNILSIHSEELLWSNFSIIFNMVLQVTCTLTEKARTKLDELPVPEESTVNAEPHIHHWVSPPVYRGSRPPSSVRVHRYVCVLLTRSETPAVSALVNPI